MAKELEVTNIRSSKSNRLEVREPEKPMLDNRDMCGGLCIVCAALIAYILSEHIPYADEFQFNGTIVCIIAVISVILFWITQKIVWFCYKRAKRKAVGQAGD